MISPGSLREGILPKAFRAGVYSLQDKLLSSCLPHGPWTLLQIHFCLARFSVCIWSAYPEQRCLFWRDTSGKYCFQIWPREAVFSLLTLTSFLCPFLSQHPGVRGEGVNSFVPTVGFQPLLLRWAGSPLPYWGREILAPLEV